MGEGQKRRQGCGTERGDITVGVLVIGIKGQSEGKAIVKRGMCYRESRH